MKEKMKARGIRFYPEDWDRIIRTAKKMKGTPSDVVRTAVFMLFDGEKL